MHLDYKEKIKDFKIASYFMTMLCILLRNTEHSLFLRLENQNIRNKSPPSINEKKLIGGRR